MASSIIYTPVTVSVEKSGGGYKVSYTYKDAKICNPAVTKIYQQGDRIQFTARGDDGTYLRHTSDYIPSDEAKKITIKIVRIKDHSYVVMIQGADMTKYI